MPIWMREACTRRQPAFRNHAQFYIDPVDAVLSELKPGDRVRSFTVESQSPKCRHGIA
jgi:hypothetical protein